MEMEFEIQSEQEPQGSQLCFVVFTNSKGKVINYSTVHLETLAKWKTTPNFPYLIEEINVNEKTGVDKELLGTDFRLAILQQRSAQSLPLEPSASIRASVELLSSQNTEDLEENQSEFIETLSESWGETASPSKESCRQIKSLKLVKNPLNAKHKAAKQLHYAKVDPETGKRQKIVSKLENKQPVVPIRKTYIKREKRDLLNEMPDINVTEEMVDGILYRVVPSCNKCNYAGDLEEVRTHVKTCKSDYLKVMGFNFEGSIRIRLKNICSLCRKDVLRADLQAHSAFHNEFAKFFCTKCQQYFMQEDELKAHHATNCGFPCVFCSRVFQSKNSLNLHKRTHMRKENAANERVIYDLSEALL